jgi:hypothetical protein
LPTTCPQRAALFVCEEGSAIKTYLKYNDDNANNVYNDYNGEEKLAASLIGGFWRSVIRRRRTCPERAAEPALSEPLCGDEGFSNAASMYSDAPMLSRRKST